MTERLRLMRAVMSKVFEATLNPGPAIFDEDAPPPGSGPGGAMSPGMIAARKILPPYLGELGLEVRYFLAAVEPWLRNGWRIPARRPDLYPPGTAFADPALFQEIDTLLEGEGARPVGCRLTFAGGTGGQCTYVEPSLISGRFSMTVVNRETDDLERLRRAARLEASLKQILVRRKILRPRPLTVWDRLLTGMSDADPVTAVIGVEPLVPSYLPQAFARPRHAAAPHVGVQLRALGDSRDSDVPRVMALAAAAAAHLGVPLLAYGHPAGTVRPAGCQTTAALAAGNLLEYELSALTQCRLMFSPNSGWFDLMCWLRVPTILEWQPDVSAIGLAGMRGFHPRLALRDPEQPIEAQVDRLLAQAECLPDPAAAPVQNTYFDWDSAWIENAMQVFVNDGNWQVHP